MTEARVKCPGEREVRYAWVDATHEVMVFRARGEIYACNAICPHMGARLQVDFGSGVLRCPWHGLTASIPGFSTGHHRFRQIRQYPVALRGDEVEITY